LRRGLPAASATVRRAVTGSVLEVSEAIVNQFNFKYYYQLNNVIVKKKHLMEKNLGIRPVINSRK
jgi:hypothetical protein